MAPYSHKSRSRQNESSETAPQGYAFSNTSYVGAESTCRNYYTYTTSSQLRSSASSNYAQNTTPTPYTSENYNAVQREQHGYQQYHEVSRHWTSRNPEIDRAMDDPALAYSNGHNYNLNYDYGYNAHAAQTYLAYPETSVSSHGMSRRLNESNLRSFEGQTSMSSSMVRWQQEAQQESSWNVVGRVGKESDYKKYNTRL